MKTPVYLLCLLATFCILPSFKATSFTHIVKQEVRDANWAIKQIKALPEVKHYMTITPPSGSSKVILGGEPNKYSPYYWIKVGMPDNLGKFHTSYDLYIDPKTTEIRYWDKLCPEYAVYLITLEEWRFWGNKPGWTEPHTYKNGQLVVLKD